MGKHDGYISEEILGRDSNKKWSDLWYIYIPKNYNKTLAQMTDMERDNRKRDKYSIDSLEVFAKWYENRKEEK